MGNKFKFATHLVNIKNANSKFNEITKVKKYRAKNTYNFFFYYMNVLSKVSNW